MWLAFIFSTMSKLNKQGDDDDFFCAIIKSLAKSSDVLVRTFVLPFSEIPS